MPWAGLSSLEVSGQKEEVWQGINLTTYTRSKEWAAKQAFIDPKMNCLDTWQSIGLGPARLFMSFDDHGR